VTLRPMFIFVLALPLAALAGCGGTSPTAAPVEPGAPPAATEAVAEAPTEAPTVAENPTAPVESGEAIVDAFKAAGLEAENPTPMTKDDYGLGPYVCKGVHFFVPSIDDTAGGRAFVCDNKEDADAIAGYYEAAGKASAMLFSWVFRNEVANTVVQINGNLPEGTARKYEAVLKGEAPPLSTDNEESGATNTPAASGVGTKDNPVPLGVPAKVGDWEMTVTTVNPDAGTAVAAENEFNEAPAEGRTFVLIGLKGNFSGADSDSGSVFGDLSYKVLGSGGNTYSDTCGVIPNDITDSGETFTGASVEGNLCFSVDTAQIDGATLILEEAFSLSEDSRMFFALK